MIPSARHSKKVVIIISAVITVFLITLELILISVIFANTLVEGKAPERIDLSGLYDNIAVKLIKKNVLPYTPQYPLWSDGAQKQRWIYIPPGKQIDARNPNLWFFPAGTKIWKEFSFNGRRVETRLIEALPNGNLSFSTYIWNEREDQTVLAPISGVRGIVEIQNGIRHDIPSVKDCQACHVGVKADVLGFSALQLSTERDPDTPYAEPLRPGDVTLEFLINSRKIKKYPVQWSKRPPRIEARTPLERSALGYMHANCGNCHNANNNLGTANMLLRHDVASNHAAEAAIMTTVNKTAGGYRIPGIAAGNNSYLIYPGAPGKSAIYTRMATRNPYQQMPPLGTKIIDEKAVQLLGQWIGEDLTR
jgi:hypothetical protein